MRTPHGLRPIAAAALCLAGPIMVAGPAAAQEPAEIGHPEVSAATFEHTLKLPGSPEQIYDIVTGDISAWWDHSVSGDPAVFKIEPWPGGRFLEQFSEDSRDGVVHATVTVAMRPSLLRMEGPLGLTGLAVHGVYTYQLAADGDSTRLTLSAHLIGEGAEDWGPVVERVWRHFLFDRLKPYVAGDLP